MTSPVVASPAAASAAAPAGSTGHLAAELALLDERLRRLAEHAGGDLDDLAAAIDAAVDAADEPPRLVALATMFGLAAVDVDVLVACLAREIDPASDRRYAVLQGAGDYDAERRLPSVGLLLDLLCGRDLPARLAGRRRFAADAPLRRHGLVRIVEPDPPGALPSAGVAVERRVAGFLLEEDAPDPALLPLCRIDLPERGLSELVLAEPDAAVLAGLAARPAVDLLVHLRGAPGAGRGAIAAALCAEWGAALLTVDSAQVATTPLEALPDLLRALCREARLDGAVLCWADLDELLAPDQRSRLRAVLDAMAEHPAPVIVCSRAPWTPDEPRLGVVQVPLTAPGFADRVRLWAGALGPGAGAAQAAARYRIGAGRVHAVAAAATTLAMARGTTGPTAGDVGTAGREHARLALDGLARCVEPRHVWTDIVLPADRTDQLREIADQVRHRAVVHEQWGFPGSAAGGQGLTLLFAGPPGTGKTMAAGVLARDLGLDLHVVDLALTVSKYIGETERNLDRIFDAAAGSTTVLFFDEADALFGKRTQVRDAHDRYANLQTSYLLQRLESHDGLVVLATNLRKNVDEAFARRLAATIEFPLPDAADRLRLWQGVWPDGVPRADLDLELLARQVALAGGNIHNIALAAAFRAAADGGTVTMAHVLAAAAREYRKLGSVDLPAGLSG